MIKLVDDAADLTRELFRRGSSPVQELRVSVAEALDVAC